MISHLNNKGQLTLPKTMRDVLEIGENSAVELMLDTKKKVVTIRNLNKKEDNIKMLRYLTQNEDLIVLVQGSAGSGKTELVKELTKGKRCKGIDNSYSLNLFPDGDICIYDDVPIENLTINDIPKEQTYITSQLIIDVKTHPLLQKTNRPILEVVMGMHYIMQVIIHNENESITLI